MSTPRSLLVVCESLLAILIQPSNDTVPVCAGPLIEPVTLTLVGSVRAGRCRLSTVALALLTVTLNGGGPTVMS